MREMLQLIESSQDFDVMSPERITACYLVPQERLELSRLSAPASKTGVSTIPPPGLIKKPLNTP